MSTEAPDPLHHPIENGSLVGEVTVDRHGIHAELLTQAPHRQPIHAATIDDAQGGIDDRRRGDRRSFALVCVGHCFPQFVDIYAVDYNVDLR